MDKINEKVKKLFSEGDFTGIKEILFPDPVCRIIVSSIFAACELLKVEMSNFLPNLPHRNRWACGHRLQYQIDKILTFETEKRELDRLPFEYRERKVPTSGFTYYYTEYFSDSGYWQVKKANTKGILPDARYPRLVAAQSNYYPLGVEFEDDIMGDSKEILDGPFAIVVFGHDQFSLQFVTVGFPESDYSAWIKNFDITDNLSVEMGENIKERELSHVDIIKSEFVDSESIENKVNLRLK
jgi:hypothetical protein